MHQHTPGPWNSFWLWKSWPCDDDSTSTEQVWSPHRKLSIACIHGVAPCDDSYSDSIRPGHRAECIANARLIAAAPELLDALTMALPYFVQFVEMAEQDDSHKPGEAAKMVQRMTLEVMEDAIAKATTAGETHERT